MVESNVFVSGGVVAFLYIIAKIIEMRFITSEAKPIKVVIRDGLVVYLCFIAGYYLMEQFGESPIIQGPPTQAFTDTPGF